MNPFEQKIADVKTELEVLALEFEELASKRKELSKKLNNLEKLKEQANELGVY